MCEFGPVYERNPVWLLSEEGSIMAKKARLGSGKRFSSLKRSLARKGARNPGALAAHIGRKKYGAKKMSSMAAKGRKRRSK
jgi:hypothetical protein